jgi:hypothetical protein
VLTLDTRGSQFYSHFDEILKLPDNWDLDLVGGVVGPRLTAQCTEEGDNGAIMSIHFFLDHEVLAPVFARYVYDVLRMYPIMVIS